VVGAAGAVGERRVAGIAPLHLDQPTRQIVMGMLEELRADRVPLNAPRWRRPVQWVSDGLVAEVRYLERTPTGLLRHASARAVSRSGDRRSLRAPKTAT
jgi:ATP-dependent DNA ligase